MPVFVSVATLLVWTEGFEYHTMQPPREAYAMVLRKGWMMNLQVQEEKL